MLALIYDLIFYNINLTSSLSSRLCRKHVKYVGNEMETINF